MDVQIPYLPDISGMEDQQLKDFLIAVKQTLEILTGGNTNSNTAVIDLLNANQ